MAYILVGTTRAFRKCDKRAPLTKNRLWAPFVARNYVAATWCHICQEVCDKEETLTCTDVPFQTFRIACWSKLKTRWNTENASVRSSLQNKCCSRYHLHLNHYHHHHHHHHHYHYHHHYNYYQHLLIKFSTLFFVRMPGWTRSALQT